MKYLFRLNISLYTLYILHLFKKSFFLIKYFKNKKALQHVPKGLKLSWLPLLDAFRTFKGNIAIEDTRLIS